MAFDSKKTILLEKTYLYVRASLGFQLEGTSTEKIPTNNGFYRFFVDNLQKAIGNSYVNILYDSQDLTLQCFCSDLYMDELMSSDSSAIEDVVEELKKNTTTIVEFENGVSSALASNHEDNVASYSLLNSLTSLLSTSISPSSLNSGILSDIPFNSFLGGADVGFNSEYFYYFIDVDKFILTFNNCSYEDLVNVKGSRYIYTYFDSLFAFNTSFNIDLLSKKNGNLLYNRNNISLKINKPDGTSNDFSSYGSPLFLRISLRLLPSGFSKFLFTSHSKKYSFNCCVSDSTLSRIHLIAPDYVKCCCINQNLDFLCLSDNLDFRFDCDYEINKLLGLTYHFTTDEGVLSFKGSDIGLHYSSTYPNTVVCAPFPSGFVGKRICKISVSKT